MGIDRSDSDKVAELPADQQNRLERFKRSVANRRGRKSPAVMPSRLARTSAFAPRVKGLSTDSTFERLYVVKPHTIVEVRGRELGSQHRDALYALFKLRARRTVSKAPNEYSSSELPYYRTDTSWRELLRATGRTPHVNNLGTLLRTFEELRSVSFRFFEGDFNEYELNAKTGMLRSAGYSDNLLGLIEWDGVSLDSSVKVSYGEWVRRMFETQTLASIDGDTYFQLRSDYAKAIWPFIDSQPNYNWISVETLADLVGRQYSEETTRQRVKLREMLRQAFADMVRCGGLASWECHQTGSGRSKSYRFSYLHARPLQAEATAPELHDPD